MVLSDVVYIKYPKVNNNIDLNYKILRIVNDF